MPDMERADQILAIGQVLARIPTGNKNRPYQPTPAPIIGMWATELHDKFGVRVHADLAKEELVRVGPASAGNHRPVQSVTKGTPATTHGPQVEVSRMQSARVALLEWLDAQDPVLARRVRAAEGSPMDQARLLAEIQRDHPEVVAKGEEILANTPAEKLV